MKVCVKEELNAFSGKLHDDLQFSPKDLRTLREKFRTKIQVFFDALGATFDGGLEQTDNGTEKGDPTIE